MCSHHEASPPPSWQQSLALEVHVFPPVEFTNCFYLTEEAATDGGLSLRDLASPEAGSRVVGVTRWLEEGRILKRLWGGKSQRRSRTPTGTANLIFGFESSLCLNFTFIKIKNIKTTNLMVNPPVMFASEQQYWCSRVSLTQTAPLKQNFVSLGAFFF